MIHMLKSVGAAAGYGFWFAVRRAAPMLLWLMWLPLTWAVAADLFKTVATSLDPFTGFKVISVNVPNHCVGTNPIIHVTRFIKAPAPHGRYQSQFLPSGVGGPVCPHDGSPRTYKPQENILYAPRLYDYFGEAGQCWLTPGRSWQGELNWLFDRPWRLDAPISIKTNPFEVWPENDARCRAYEPHRNTGHQ
jgi:hypothetical protein